MTLSQGYFSKPFIAQVAPGQNQHLKNAKWQDAHGDRVRIRIPGKHPVTNEVKDENLPWAIVAHPTSHGNLNGGSCGIWGGEWVIACYMDEEQQIPVILSVLGNNLTQFDIRESKNGTTEFKRVDRFNSGLTPGGHQIIGDSTKPRGPAQPTKEEIKEANKDPQSKNTSESGVPKEPIITESPDGTKTVTIIDADGNKTNYPYKNGDIPPSSLATYNKMQETAFNQQMSKEATLRGDDASATFYANRAAGRETNISSFNTNKLSSSSISVAQYTAKDKAEDKLLLRSIQKGELGPVPREQIDQLINRINGVGGQVRGV